MVITRKIEIYVREPDEEKKKNYIHTIYVWRDWVRKAANLIVSHRFVQQNVRDFMYLQDDVLERLNVSEKPFVFKDKKTEGFKLAYKNPKDIIKDEKGLSEQNTTYRLVASFLKNKVPSDIYSCLNRIVAHSYKETAGNIAVGESSLRSYKNNIPMPFSVKALSNIHRATEEYTDTETGEIKNVTRYLFTLFGIPFVCRLGRDRSNNKVMLERCIEGEYKICSSSIAFQKVADRVTGEKKQKLFLHLCIDIPKQEIELNPKKVMYCYLGITHPIVYNYESPATSLYDNSVTWSTIGDAEEFLHRRIQIQNALRRCQMSCRWAKGGKGRKRKLQATNRFAEKEKNYVQTKLHTYSRELINRAIENKCATIFLVNQKAREKKAKEESQKGDPFLLRNWSYFGLKTMIEYKAKMYGIKVPPTKKPKEKPADNTK